MKFVIVDESKNISDPEIEISLRLEKRGDRVVLVGIRKDTSLFQDLLFFGADGITQPGYISSEMCLGNGSSTMIIRGGVNA